MIRYVSEYDYEYVYVLNRHDNDSHCEYVHDFFYCHEYEIYK